jgi:muconolactone D-isomerase
MLFQVSMTIRIPRDADPDKVGALSALEHERAAALQRQGKWLHLRRVVGSYANVSIFKVDSSDELHAILESLPLYPFMEVRVTALCRHPGALADAE